MSRFAVLALVLASCAPRHHAAPSATAPITPTSSRCLNAIALPPAEHFAPAVLGKPAWSVPLDHPLNLVVTAAGDAIVTTTSDVIALDRDGTPAWTASGTCRGTLCSARPVPGALPVLAPSRVLVGMDPFSQVAFDPCGTPTVLDQARAQDVAQAGVSAGPATQLATIGIEDGRERLRVFVDAGGGWRFALADHDAATAPPIFDSADGVYLGTRHGHVIAFSPEGEPRWDHVITDHAISHLLVDDTAIYATTKGALVALVRATGDQRWMLSIPYAGALATPARDATSIYLTTPDELVAVALDGTVRWRQKRRFLTAPVTDGHHIFAATRTAIIAFDPTGAVAYEKPVTGTFAIAIADTTLYVLTATKLLAFR